MTGGGTAKSQGVHCHITGGSLPHHRHVAPCLEGLGARGLIGGAGALGVRNRRDWLTVTDVAGRTDF